MPQPKNSAKVPNSACILLTSRLIGIRCFVTAQNDATWDGGEIQLAIRIASWNIYQLKVNKSQLS